MDLFIGCVLFWALGAVYVPFRLFIRAGSYDAYPDPGDVVAVVVISALWPVFLIVRCVRVAAERRKRRAAKWAGRG